MRFVPALLLILMLIQASAFAAPPPRRGANPDWPCEQLLVPHLTAASYWNGSLDASGNWHDDKEVAALVASISPRRVTTEEGLKKIDAFARSVTTDRMHRLELLFRGLLEATDQTRAGLIEELKGIGRRQRELAQLVEKLRAQLDAMPPEATGAAAAKRVDLQQRHDFSARNFDEIQRTIRYACEAPVALEARLGAWTRALQKAAKD
jgi:hypothetical protein